MTVFNCASYPTPQDAINALQAAGGGELHVSQNYALTTPLTFSGLVATEVVGDGAATGFTYTGAGPGFITCGTVTPNVNPGVRFRNLRIATVMPNVLAILSRNEANPVYENVCFDGFQCNTWFVQTWGPHFVNCAFEGSSYCAVGFDPGTPANQVVLDRCKGYGNGTVLQANAGCNGIHILNGDYENNATLLDFPSITYIDPWDNQLGRCSIIRIEGNDLEQMTGETITSQNPLHGLTFAQNTTSGTHSNDFGNNYQCNGLIYKNNNIHNMAVTIKSSNCPSYELGFYDLQYGGTFAVV